MISTSYVHNDFDVDNDEKMEHMSTDQDEALMVEKEVFIKSAVERAMNIYWPDPASEFYCRVCNYFEFDSKESLIKHEQTDEHQLRVTNETSAFCLICQVHTCNEEIFSKHVEGVRHIKLRNIFEETEANAQVFWHNRNEQIKEEDLLGPICLDDYDVDDDEENVDDSLDVSENTQISDLKGNILKLQEIFSKHGNRYKEACELMKIKIREYFDENYIFTGLPDDQFNIYAVQQCMKDSHLRIKRQKYTCSECNYVRLSDKYEKQMHMLSDSHKAYVAAKKLGYFCKICKINHLNEDSYKKHLKDEEHIKLACLVFVCKNETYLVKEEKNKLELDYKRIGNQLYEKMIARLYPEGGMVQDLGFCRICSQDTKGKLARKHASGHNSGHARSFDRFIQKIKDRGFVFTDGCALCRVSKLDDNFYNMEDHVKKIEHLQNFVAYVRSNGLVDVTGITGIFAGDRKQHYHPMNENAKLIIAKMVANDISSRQHNITNSNKMFTKMKRKRRQNKKDGRVPHEKKPKLE